MTRLSVTLDEETAEDLEQLPKTVTRMFTRFDEDELARLFVERPRTLRSVTSAFRELGENPSASAILRQAAVTFVALARELEEITLLEEGYSALAEDAEREAVLETLAAEAGDRWAGEP